MEEKKNRLKEHIFIGIISLAILIACIILTIHFAKDNPPTFDYILGWVILDLWLPTILPSGYYYFRAEANSIYQRQPKFIFHDRFNFFFFIILLAPILFVNYIWLLFLDIRNGKNGSFE